MVNVFINNAMFSVQDDNGDPGNGFKVYFYVAGTSTEATVYQNINLTTPHTMPITLDSAGRKKIYGSGTFDIQVWNADESAMVWEMQDVEILNASNYTRTLLPKTTASAWRTALGLGTAAIYDVGTSAGNVVQLDSQGRLPAVDGSLLTGLTTSQLTDFEQAVFIRNYIDGFTITRASATTITVSAGMCADSGNTENMETSSAITKALTVDGGWTVGTGQEGLENGSTIIVGRYYVYVIKRVDTNVVDILISDDPNTPTLPANYTKYRYIGMIYVESIGTTVITDFIQKRDHFYYKAFQVEQTLSPVQENAWTSVTLTKVPAREVQAILRLTITGESENDNTSDDLNPHYVCVIPFDGEPTSGVGGEAFYQDFRINHTTGPSASNFTIGMDTTHTGSVWTGVDSNESKLKFRSYSTGGAAYTPNVEIYTSGWIDPRGKE